ncbi:MAG: iron-containing alcohol dehydrogenase family protein, partial [Acidimicrobiales bacterium]
MFGAGALARLPELVRALGSRRVLLVTTEGRFGSDDGQRVASLLGSGLASTFAEVESHVPVPLVQRAVQQARRDGADAVVSFGGGSCADLGKAVCFFVEHELGTPGASWADRPALPHISIPTTYSGAELTPFFGMTDPATRAKSGSGGPTCAPLAAVYDPEVTLSTPPRISAETGMNALAHCVEIVYSPHRTPEADAIGLAGAARIVRALPLVVDDPDDLTVRASMLEGAVLAGRCLQNGTMGVHHGLAQLVGGRTGIPHGLANAVILAHALRFNAEAVPD